MIQFHSIVQPTIMFTKFVRANNQNELLIDQNYDTLIKF